MIALAFVAGVIIGFLLAWGIGRGQVVEAMRATYVIASETVFLLERFCEILERLVEEKVDKEIRERDGGDGPIS